MRESYHGDVAALSLGVRASGVLLHPTSLPGRYGSGDLGASARRFADFLSDAGQRWWQMLPVAPPGYGNSPYSAESAFAGSPLLIDLDDLAARGWLDARELNRPSTGLPSQRVDYAAAHRFRGHQLTRAFQAFQQQRSPEQEALRLFRERTQDWIEDYALFRALKRRHGVVAWTDWSPEVRDRDPGALGRARRELAGDIDQAIFEQWVFDAQWTRFREYCRGRGVRLIGDLPIFVAHDSADVWQRRDLFRLDEAGQPIVVAGVPPDYFSETGQRWGNPLWRRLRRTGYAWWVERLRTSVTRFDVVRLDHFIGFQRYWEIPASEPTAVRGRWMKGPRADFFRVVKRELGVLPLIAEDLGAVTPAVKALRDRFHLPGIRVLQFAFGDDPSAPDFLPHNYPRRAVVYTGTHDNDTIVGWFHEPGGERNTRTPEQTARERESAMRYLGSSGHDIHWDMIRMALLSVADLAIFPLQDVLGLGTEARMNMPGTNGGNWEWRFEEGVLRPELATKLRRLTETYGRIGASPAPAERAGGRA
jgi:4-alpha-glucanotransferase